MIRSDNNWKVNMSQYLINWERTANGSCAELKIPPASPVLSRSYANGLVKSLMHEVILISAALNEKNEISFGRCAEISIFGKSSAEFYGLYMSSNSNQLPNYCLRRFFWNGNFKSLDELSKGISAEILFFDSDDLTDQLKNIVEKLDGPAIEEGEIITLSVERQEFKSTTINYYFTDQSKTSNRSYRRNLFHNEIVENLFESFLLMHKSVKDSNSMNLDAGALNILYASDCYRRILNP